MHVMHALSDTGHLPHDGQRPLPQSQQLGPVEVADHEYAAVAAQAHRSGDSVRIVTAPDDQPLGRHGLAAAHGASYSAHQWPALREETSDIVLHLVGQLQSNKASEAVAMFDAIHSLDRASLLGALVKEGEKTARFPSVYVQVNIGEEEQKGGCSIGEVGSLVASVRSSPLPLAGLMAIPPLDVEPSPYFALLAKLARRHDVNGLSIGMSGDFEAAVMLGATAVRVGTALFED